MDTLEREVRRAERSNHVFALLLLDLGELKAINDKQGHLLGNRALKRLSEVINIKTAESPLLPCFRSPFFVSGVSGRTAAASAGLVLALLREAKGRKRWPECRACAFFSGSIDFIDLHRNAA